MNAICGASSRTWPECRPQGALCSNVYVSPQLLEHFRNPRNVGELPPPAITVEVSNPVCGDILRLSALIENGRIARTGFKVRGCTASIAAGSALTELIGGRDKAELQRLKAADVDRAVGGLSNESKHAAALCVDAVKALAARF
jgi:nitrogen fixation protein NifU and related proteins